MYMPQLYVLWLQPHIKEHPHIIHGLNIFQVHVYIILYIAENIQRAAAGAHHSVVGDSSYYPPDIYLTTLSTPNKVLYHLS
jgi:hypothetical protein